MNKLVLLVPFLTAFPSLLFGVAEHVICVDSDSGHDNATCLQSCQQPCQTLEYVQRHLKSVANESVVIKIRGPQINLTGALNFTNFSNLSIRGTKYAEIFCDTSYSGLSFNNVTRLSLSYIQLTNCGAGQNSTVYDTSKYRMITELSAVFLLNCRDVNITNCVIYRSDGTGISMLNTNGNVFIEHTNIIESSLRSNSSDIMMFGGSGLHIEFDYCSNGNHAYNHTNCSRSEHYSNAYYMIYKCTITGNRANASQSLEYWYNIGPMGSGGGAHFGFAINAANISITLNNCSFHNNSAVMYGGGLKLQFYKTTHKNQVSLIHTIFSNNSVPSDKMGGGLEVSFSHFTLALKNYDHLENNSVNVKSCNFSGNSAGSGGGLNVFSGEIPFHDELSAITFTNCTWSSNTALYGAAVHIMPATWASEYQGHYPKIEFVNCSIDSNMVTPKYLTTNLQIEVNGFGAFFCSHITISFVGVTIFEGNNGTALYLSGSVGIFNASSQVVFHNNNGTNGGAVSLVGRSFLLLNGSSNFSFKNNRAKQLGGGIYFHSTGNNNHQNQPCFIYRGFYTKNSSFIFNNNHASTGRGHHIFVSSFTSCNINCPGPNLTTYECIGEFNFSHPDHDTTATLPTEFNFDTNHTMPIGIIPGFSSYLPLVVRDSKGNTVSNLSYEASLEGKSPKSSMDVDSAFKYVSNNTIRLSGEGNATLRLDTLSTDISLLVNITLAECPPGYVLDPSDHTCKCRASTYYGLQKCDPEAYIMYGVWMGCCNHNSNALCTANCPVGYCTYNLPFSLKGLYRPLPLSTKNLEAFICPPTRIGTICGQCRPGHSVYYNSWDFQCHEDNLCHLGPLFFMLSTIIPLTLLFIVITFLDTNFAGKWNGFIFFSQMVTFLYIYANGTVRFPNAQFQILTWLMFTYSFFNLEIFNINQLSFCIWKGAGVMDILMVKLASILFALALVLFTLLILRQHKLTKCFPCLSRRRFSVLNGISAFFIFCYAQCARTCFQVLDAACLYDENSECYKRVVLYSGNMSVFEGKHIKYATVAVVFLIFIVILPPVILLFYPLFFKILGLCGLSDSKFATYLWKMIPIQVLDSFQNPFKDNCRVFSGLYFLYRAIALASYALKKNLVHYYAAIELELALMILLHGVFNPYKSRIFNIIDFLLFLNLSFINGITLYNYVLYTLSKNSVENDTHFWITVQLLLLVLPLMAAGIYLFGKLALQLSIHIKSLRNNMSSATRHGYEEIDPLT